MGYILPLQTDFCCKHTYIGVPGSLPYAYAFSNEHNKHINFVSMFHWSQKSGLKSPDDFYVTKQVGKTTHKVCKILPSKTLVNRSVARINIANIKVLSECWCLIIDSSYKL